MSFLHKGLIEHVLYPAMELAKGNKIRKITKELIASGRSAGWKTAQQEQLKKLLCHCAQTVPAYQSLKEHAAEIEKDPMKALISAVAPLTKQAFRQCPEQFFSSSMGEDKRISNCTGGSTGEPIRFFMDRAQVERYEAARWRGLSWYGISQGSRSVMLWGNPLELNANAAAKHRRREAMLKNRTVISAYELTEAKITEYVAQINHYKPEYIYGYATALTAFASMMLKRKLKLNITLKAVVSTSETLFDEDKETIELAFHCPVANEYGARDAGILAFSCPQGRLHITAENCIIEVLDPETLEPCKAGDSGLLAVTDLGNYVQPRLRYLLGDVGALAPDCHACACGCTLPVFSRVQGREDALLKRPDGVLVHGHVINHMLRGNQAVETFQFLQHSPEKATLKIVFNRAGMSAADVPSAKLHELLPGVDVEVQVVSSLPLAPSGKFHYVVREFSL